jgi:S-formylglutathione hydrolase FrmB
MGWQELSLESEALRGNPLGDASARALYVWTPPGYDDDPEQRFPAVYLLHPMTGQVRAWFNVAPFTKNVPELVDELGLGAIVVLVDGWTALGGSQWLDSPAVGQYATYLCEEVVGFVDASFRTLAAPAHRGLAGRSSGGFGAMVWSMLRPDLFGGFATHAGDALFEVAYVPELPAAAQALRNTYDGSFERFWEDIRSGRPVFANQTDPLLQNVYAMTAAYSPRADGGVDLPFRVDTGELVPEVWERWLAWDPVRLAPRHAEALRAARAIWIDAGRSDEYHLDLGATAFAREIRAAGVDESRMHFELHDGGHNGTNWRLPLSLSFLADRLGQ